MTQTSNQLEALVEILCMMRLGRDANQRVSFEVYSKVWFFQTEESIMIYRQFSTNEISTATLRSRDEILAQAFLNMNDNRCSCSDLADIRNG